MQGRRRRQGGGPSLTCGEGGGGDAAPRSVLGRLQEHRVVCALGQALQSDPRVLRVHNQLLKDEPGEGGGRWLTEGSPWRGVGREVQTPRSVLQ